MKSFFSCVVLLSLVTIKDHPPQKTTPPGTRFPTARNLFIITIDGFRWQELFQGADPEILSDERYTPDTSTMQLLFGGENNDDRRKKLLPFFWNVVAKTGQLYGNRNYESKVNVANIYSLSYPGYNEIFTGNTDIGIATNDKKRNPNLNVLAYLQTKDSFKGRIAAFTSWDVFPYILDRDKNKLMMNSGYEHEVANLNDNETLIKKVEKEAVQERAATRHDQLTFLTAMEYLKKEQPRILFLGLGETDEAAHNGRYDNYLQKAMEADAMIAALWHWVQTTPGYRDNTTFIITTDHGRGRSTKNWTNHGMLVKGSSQTWLALLGPGIEALGEVKKDQQLYEKQVAQTIASVVGERFESDQPIATSIVIK